MSRSPPASRRGTTRRWLRTAPPDKRDTAATVPPADTLSRRAGLTFLAGVAQSVVRAIVGLVLTPLMVRELGAVLYGSWMIIQQALGWLALTDMRPMGTLKFTLGVEQHVVDDSRKRRQVGAALRLWALTLPLTIIIGLAGVALTPRLLHLPAEYALPVQVAAALAAGGVILDRLFGLPGNILRGVNLDFKGAIAATLVIVVGALLTAAALVRNLGLPGVAGAAVTALLIGSATRYVIARRHVAWLGSERPAPGEFRKFARLSAWLMVGSSASVLFLSSDLLIVGLVLGPSAAAVYATTGAALRLVAEPLGQLLASGNAGLAGLCGRQEWSRVAAIRRELWLAALGSCTIAGVAYLLLNRAFVTVWVGPQFYAGLAPAVLLVLLAIQAQLVRVESIIADNLMLVREKTMLILLAGGCGALLAFVLTPGGGLTGMAAGALAGRAIALWQSPRLIAKRLPGGSLIPPRALAASITMLAAATAAAPFVRLERWLDLIAAGAVIVPLAAALWYTLALTPPARAQVRRRIGAAARLR